MGRKNWGKPIELSLGEKTIPVTISGFLIRKKLFCQWTWSNRSGRTNDVLPEELFQELIPDVTNFDYSWDIVCDPDKSEKSGKGFGESCYFAYRYWFRYL